MVAKVDKVTNLAAGSAGASAAVLRAPQRCFCAPHRWRTEFSQRCGGGHGQRVTTPCWECLRIHPFCPGPRHSPCLGRGVVATIVESCCVLYLMVW